MLDHADDAGKLLLRLMVGGLVLLHGFHKILTGPAGVEHMVAGSGLPGVVGWAVYLGEVLGPILILLGYYGRLGALLVLVNMAVAIWLAFGSHIWALNAHGGWIIELEACFGAGALAVFLLGAGRYSIAGRYGAWN